MEVSSLSPWRPSRLIMCRRGGVEGVGRLAPPHLPSVRLLRCSGAAAKAVQIELLAA